MGDIREYTAFPAKYPVILQLFSWDRLRKWIISISFIFIDYLAIVSAVFTAFLVRAELLPLFYQEFTVPEVYIYIIIPLAFIFFLHFDRLSLNKLYFWQQAERLLKVSIYAMLFIVVILYFSGSAKEISRVFILLVWIFSFSYLAIGRYFLKKMVTFVEILQVPTVIIGAGKTAELLLDAFSKNNGSGYKIVGLIEDYPQQSPISQRYPIIGTFAKAEEAIQQAGVRNALIAAPGLSREELLNMVYRLQPYVDNITFVPNLFGIPVSSMELETLFNEKTVLLKIKNNLAQIQNRIFKCIFDCICSILGLIVVMPLLVIISLLIYVDSPGPVIFAHRRVGYKGEMFSCYKFRTMDINSQEILTEHLAKNADAREEWQRDFKLRDDPRITRVGRFLRKTSLDELPQFFNVLRGEMSLVGPRPIVQDEVPRYGDYITDYYLVRPGITGIWQVSGRNEIDYPERVKMDSWYVRNWSLWMDIVFLVKTVKVVFKGNGAY